MGQPHAMRTEALMVGWSLLLTALLLGPALGHGYVLSYDMVWIPNLTLRPDLLGVGTALPRAVPSDAVIAVLDNALPGWLLQKLTLVACLSGGGVGLSRLLMRAPTAARLVAITVAQWNPFVVERLVLGHWPVLLGYAVLPWLVIAAARWRDTGRLPAVMGPLLVLGSLSASTGVVTAIALLAATAGFSGSARKRLCVGVMLLAAANAPWFVSGILHASDGTSDPRGARLFALVGEGSLGAPLTAFTWGGVWNAEVVPGSREGILAVMSVVLIGTLGLLGVRAVVEVLGSRTAWALGVMWIVGMLLALWTWAAPSTVASLAAHVPGGGLLRDGARQLALCVPGGACALGLGAARIAHLPGLRDARHLVVGSLVLLPILLIPDAVLGVNGDLRAVDYPRAYARAAAVIEARPAGDAVALPFTSYRQPSWNNHHKVLDPVGRYQPRDYVASDRLLVSGVLLAGEDPRVKAVARALEAPTAQARAEQLAALGIGVVIVDHDAPGDVPAVAGTTVLDSDPLEVIALEGTQVREVRRPWIVAMAAAWAAFVALAVAGPVGGLRRRLRGK